MRIRWMVVAVRGNHTSDHQARDRVDHPWDDCLTMHVCQAHKNTIDAEYRKRFSDELTDDLMWDIYCEAIAVQERKQYPIVGNTIDRICFADTSAVHNDDRTHAYLCFVCGGTHVDTCRIRSQI